MALEDGAIVMVVAVVEAGMVEVEVTLDTIKWVVLVQD
jgi:2-keto-3-deoxy-6-phosphogluconate aldolase